MLSGLTAVLSGGAAGGCCVGPLWTFLTSAPGSDGREDLRTASLQDVAGEPGAQAWNELLTRDTAKAGAFYTSLFPWKAQANPMTAPDGSSFDYTLFRRGDTNAAGMMAMPPMVPAQVPPHWMTYFTVENTAAAVKKVQSLGGEIVMGETPSPYGPWAILKDPQGAVFAVVQQTN